MISREKFVSSWIQNWVACKKSYLNYQIGLINRAIQIHSEQERAPNGVIRK